MRCFTISTPAQRLANRLQKLLIVLHRLGNGINTSTVPTWQSECSKAHRRGMLVMIEGAMITCGIMISYWIDLGFSFLDPNPVSWRFPIAFQIFFALLILIAVMELPESPRWLILKGKESEARKSSSLVLSICCNGPLRVEIHVCPLPCSKGLGHAIFTFHDGC